MIKKATYLHSLKESNKITTTQTLTTKNDNENYYEDLMNEAAFAEIDWFDNDTEF